MKELVLKIIIRFQQRIQIINFVANFLLALSLLFILQMVKYPDKISKFNAYCQGEIVVFSYNIAENQINRNSIMVGDKICFEAARHSGVSEFSSTVISIKEISDSIHLHFVLQPELMLPNSQNYKLRTEDKSLIKRLRVRVIKLLRRVFDQKSPESILITDT